MLFQTKALACHFDDHTSRWSVEIESVDGTSQQTIVADALITACGQLSEPSIPPIPGKDDFAGPSAHTAHWPVVADQLKGKKVAIVGTGASCMQVRKILHISFNVLTSFLTSLISPRQSSAGMWVCFDLISSGSLL